MYVCMYVYVLRYVQVTRLRVASDKTVQQLAGRSCHSLFTPRSLFLLLSLLLRRCRVGAEVAAHIRDTHRQLRTEVEVQTLVRAVRV